LAAEKLGERHDVRVSPETLRGWMRQAGIWLPRAERKRIQQPRHRREHVGELNGGGLSRPYRALQAAQKMYLY
jgi:hypothetical protein